MSSLEQNVSSTATAAPDTSSTMSEYLAAVQEMRSAFGAVDTDHSGTLEFAELETVTNDKSLVTGAHRRQSAQLLMNHFDDIRLFQPSYEDRPFGRDAEKPRWDGMGQPYLRSRDESDVGISRNDLVAMKLALAKTETDASIAQHRKIAKVGVVVQLGMGVTATAGGAVLSALPEPTMTTKIAGGALLMIGAGILFGAYETFEGKDIDDLESYTRLNRGIIASWD